MKYKDQQMINRESQRAIADHMNEMDKKHAHPKGISKDSWCEGCNPGHTPTSFRIENEEFILPNEWVSIEEAKRLEKDNDPMLRVYRSSPGALNIQLRAHCGIGDFGDGVKRNMIATLPISFDDAKSLISYLQEVIAKASK